MNTLEQRMLEAIEKNRFSSINMVTAKACAEIAIDEIKKALNEGDRLLDNYSYQDTENRQKVIQKYLEDNNLIEKL